MTRTSRPCALLNVKRSIFVPSGIVPNDDWVSAMTAMIIAPAMSEAHEIGDPDRFLLVGLVEDQIAPPIVAAAVAGEQLRDRHHRRAVAVADRITAPGPPLGPEMI